MQWKKSYFIVLREEITNVCQKGVGKTLDERGYNGDQKC